MMLVIGSIQLTITRVPKQEGVSIAERALALQRLEWQISEARQEAHRELALSSFGTHFAG